MDTIVVKRCFIDFETGGLNKRTSPVVSVSITVDFDGEIVGKYSSLIKPYDESLVEQKAIDVNGLDLEMLRNEKSESHVFAEMIQFLSQFVNMKKSGDKMFFVAHNAQFDDGFFRSMVYRNAGDKKVRNKIFWADLICTRVLAANILSSVRHTMENFQLGTISRVILGVKDYKCILGEYGLHNSDVDTELCREIFYEMNSTCSSMNFERIDR